ncbi:MAG: CBS domain-containing protein [Armatimonadota bacterium]|jgi:CBS domain-containing protein|nr:CBS domain-containing protein [Armatimonadota bacterium]
MRVADIMTTDVTSCKQTDSLALCATHMRDLNVGAMPVMDVDNNLVGILTDRDITVRAVSQGIDPDDALVEDFMSPNPITINLDMDVDDAAEIMADNQIRRLPIVDNTDRLIGIISLGDLAVDVGEEDVVAETLEEISIPVR